MRKRGDDVSERTQKDMVRTIEKALHDKGLVVLSHKDGENYVIDVDDPTNRTKSRVVVGPQK